MLQFLTANHCLPSCLDTIEKCISQIVVQDMHLGLQQQMRPTRSPTHLRLLYEALADHVITVDSTNDVEMVSSCRQRSP